MRRDRKPINLLQWDLSLNLKRKQQRLKLNNNTLKNKLEFEDCKLKLNFAVWAQMKLHVCQISQAVTDMWISHTFATY